MTVKELQHQLKELKRTSTSHSVTVAIMSLQQELTKPPAVFDPYRALARLRLLVDLHQDNADTKTTRFSTILYLPLRNSQFQNILLKLMGDKDVEIAKAIHKSLRSSTSPWPYSLFKLYKCLLFHLRRCVIILLLVLCSHYQSDHSEAGLLNNTQYSVCDRVPRSAW